jgi:hypothetical protein
MKSTGLKHITRLLSFTFVATCSMSAQQLLNGSFETGIPLNPQSPYRIGHSVELNAGDTTSIPGWTVRNGTIDYIGDRWQAAEGNRCLDMSGTSAGTISQNITALTLGQTYRLSFMMAGNPEAAPAIKSMQVSIGSSLKHSFSMARGSHQIIWGGRNTPWTLPRLVLA